MDDFDLGGMSDIDLEIKALKDRISEVEAENSKLKEVIVQNDLQDEIEDIDCTSLEEQLCVNGIRYIAAKVRDQDFDDKDVKSFQTLYSVLQNIRGNKGLGTTKSNKKVSTADLLRIVEKVDAK